MSRAPSNLCRTAFVDPLLQDRSHNCHGNSLGKCVGSSLGDYQYPLPLRYTGSEMTTAQTYTPDPIPEQELPAELAERGLYKPAGIACHQCSFVTKKRGFSGRQALRAHLKKHRRDVRAWQRPLVRQGVFAGFVVALAVLGLIGSAGLKADVQSALPFGVPLVTLPELVMGWGTVAVAVALLLSTLWMLAVPGEFGGQPLVRILSGLRAIGSLLGVWVGLVIWGVVSPEMSWPMMPPVLVVVGLTPVLAAKAGMVRLLVRRRGVRSASYSNLVSAKDALAGAEAWLWAQSRQRKSAGGPKRRARA